MSILATFASIAFLVVIAPMGEPPSPSAPASAPGDAKPTPDHPAGPTGARSDPGHDAPVPAVAFPYPMITEVLFAVPSTGDYDANKDGRREVSGDEFVELVNPHDRSIELRGYTITDGAPNPKSAIHFTFPAMILPAHSVVVVFNGHGGIL